jgi:hypothetical protein
MYTYVCMHVCMYVYICVHVYMHIKMYMYYVQVQNIQVQSGDNARGVTKLELVHTHLKLNPKT